MLADCQKTAIIFFNILFLPSTIFIINLQFSANKKAEMVNVFSNAYPYSYKYEVNKYLSGQ
jgi:hypothetical protein